VCAEPNPSDRPRRRRPLVNGAGLVDLQRTQSSCRAATARVVSAQSVHQRDSQAGRGKRVRGISDHRAGKTLAHGLIFAGPESLVIDTVPGQSEVNLAHLDHYLVCEQVTLADRTAEWSELLLSGAQSEALLGRFTDVSAPARLDNA
jgi:folate-binding Fe-S cluster repair protein YgfZ